MDGGRMMKAENIDKALSAYEAVTCERNLANLCVSLCINIDGDEYTDGDVIDIIADVCDTIRNDKQYDVRNVLSKWGIVPGRRS
jgi:hypothetical protein